MHTTEPSPARLPHPLRRYVLATRPAFLLASLVPVLIGLAAARYAGYTLDAGLAVLTLIGAVLAHAGANVLNDYYDARNGTDALNEDRIFPFTGGSRFIQNGVLSPAQTGRYGVALLAGAAVVGSGLALLSGPALWLIGAAGLLIGWAYSAPPLSLNARGLGEASVALGVGTLIPAGAFYVQTGAFAVLPAIAGAPYALLAANLLYINQFPDRRADALAGKRHWVVRLGPRRARWGYLTLLAAAHAVVLGAVASGRLPQTVLPALLALLPGGLAARRLVAHAEQARRLAPAIRLTLAAALGQGLALAAGLWWAA